MTHFDGTSFDPARDASRLSAQLDAVRELMLDGHWRTLGEIADQTGHPEASISARLRDLRKARHGSWTVERVYVRRGLFTYRVSKPVGGQVRLWT